MFIPFYFILNYVIFKIRTEFIFYAKVTINPNSGKGVPRGFNPLSAPAVPQTERIGANNAFETLIGFVNSRRLVAGFLPRNG